MKTKKRANRKSKFNINGKINYLKFNLGFIMFFIGLFLIVFNFLDSLVISESNSFFFFLSLIGWSFLYFGIFFHFILVKDKPFLKSWIYLKKIKNYFLFSLILFLVIGIFGFLFPYFFEAEIIKLIAELVKKTEGMSLLELIKFIIFNNVKSSFFGMIFGFFFGIIPMIILIVNGYILGFVANKTVLIEGPAVLLRLFPHGILEIPAVMISIALGLKLGIFLFTARQRDRGREFLKLFLNSLRVFLFIVIPLLIFAGIIEGGLIFLVG